MQNLSARTTENGPKEIKVGTNECRIAQHGERLVARAVLADVVVTVQVPSVGFAAMLRFSAPQPAGDSAPRLKALCDFADQALALVFESIHSMDVPPQAIVVSAMGGAEGGLADGQGNPLASAVQESLERHGVILGGSDLGGTQSRGIWLDSASGRLIVRSASTDSGSATRAALQSQSGETSEWLTAMRRDAIA